MTYLDMVSLWRRGVRMSLAIDSMREVRHPLVRFILIWHRARGV
jgi:hypothetical protein